MTWAISGMGEQIGLWTKCSCAPMPCADSNALLAASAAFFMISFLLLIVHAIIMFCHSRVAEAAFENLP